MSKCVLITGGAGFIGSALADDLLHHHYRVRILDPRPAPGRDDALRRADVEWFQGTVEDATLLATALDGVGAVIHLAARRGARRGWPDVQLAVTRHGGTPILLEALLRRPVERFVLASGSCIYGEGLYRDTAGALVTVSGRSRDQLACRAWDLRDISGALLTPVATPESSPLSLTSAGALSKYDQERMCLLIGRAHAIPTTVLRFFNVYGPHQALDSPSANVFAQFGAQLLGGAAPVVFEDGRQRRDFVHVRDVARACRLVIETPAATDRIINIGGGEGVAIADLARQFARILGRPVEPEITHRHRPGDVRHRVADISLARSLLGYAPQLALADGLADFANWLESLTLASLPVARAWPR